jgi:hypothetical protein
MRTLSFAVAIAAVTVAHAEPIEDYLQTLRGFSGPHDMTVLIGVDGSIPSEPCRRVLTELHPATPARNVYYKSRIEGECRRGPMEILDKPSMPP